MRSEFEKHYLSLDFYTKGSAQLCIDACTFDEKQDAYLPNMGWILENDEDECVAYCLMLNTAYLSFKHQQSKVDELQKKLDEYIFVAESIDEMYVKEVQKNNELQKRVDSALWLLKVYKDEMDHGFEVSKATVKKLEQALNGGCDEN